MHTYRVSSDCQMVGECLYDSQFIHHEMTNNQMESWADASPRIDQKDVERVDSAEGEIRPCLRFSQPCWICDCHTAKLGASKSFDSFRTNGQGCISTRFEQMSPPLENRVGIRGDRWPPKAPYKVSVRRSRLVCLLEGHTGERHRIETSAQLASETRPLEYSAKRSANACRLSSDRVGSESSSRAASRLARANMS